MTHPPTQQSRHELNRGGSGDDVNRVKEMPDGHLLGSPLQPAQQATEVSGSSTLKGDSKKTISFLEWMQPQGPWVLVAIPPEKIGIEAATFFPNEKEACLEWLEQRNAKRNLYFHLNKVSGRLSRKASKADMKQAEWLHVDVDPRKDHDIPTEQKRILDAFRNPPNDIPRPTLIIFSGGGYQAFWKLKHPFLLDGDLTRAGEIERYNRYLEQSLGGDNCHNVDRIMRLPFTVNLPDEKKRKKGRTAALANVAEMHPGEAHVYPLGQFKQPSELQSQDKNGRILGDHEPIQISGNIPRLASLEALNEWKVPDRIPALIVSGTLEDIEGPKKGDNSRSGWLFDCICGLVRCNVPADVIYGIITDNAWAISASVLDKGRGMDRYAKRQIQRAIAELSEPELEELNARHAVLLNEGGKTLVLTNMPERVSSSDPRRRNAVAMQTFEDITKRYLNRMIDVGKPGEKAKLKSLGRWWLEHPMRRQYEASEFEPGASSDFGEYLNLWRGFGVSATEGRWPLMQQHILEVLANGDEHAAEYILNWGAWAIQNPGLPAEVALVFRGGHGTGKGTFGRALMDLFGRHGLHVSSMQQVSGHFNSHLRDCCLLFADEVYVAGDRSSEAQLKRLITEPTLMIEGKGRDAILSANHLHVVMASNSAWVAPVGSDERRYALFDVSEARKDDKEYFSALYAEIEAGGLSAMLFDLQQRDLGRWHPRSAIPKNDALQEQKAHSLLPIDEWIEQLLQGGRLPTRSAQSDRVTNAELRADRNLVVPAAQLVSQNAMSRALRRMGCEPFNTGRDRGFTFPALSQMRRTWEARFGAWSWENDLKEWYPTESDGEATPF